MTVGCSEQLANFTANLVWNRLPAEIVEKVKLHLLDTLGVSLRAAHSPQVGQAVRAVFAAGAEGAPDCTILGHKKRASVLEAAYLNASMGHVLDFDDVHKFLHPSAALVPTALAVAERDGGDGKRVIQALAAGYEVSIRLSLAADVAHRDKGYSPTGTCNHLGTAATAGLLLGLNTSQINSAFGVAGNQAGGLTQHQYGGGHTKHLNSAIAARGGILAAYLAREGFRAPDDIIEGKLGFLNVLSDGGDVDQATAGLGDEFALMWTNLKPYPSCRQGHGAVDLILAMIAEHGFTHAEINKVTLETYPFAYADWFSTNAAPANEVEAALRTPFALATVLVHGAITLESLTSPHEVVRFHC